jgi:hypothetical protein
MKCLNCGEEDFDVFVTETFPCGKCGGSIVVEYNVCKNCGLMCKSVDGNLLTASVFMPEEFSDEDIEEIFGFLNEPDMCLNMDYTDDSEKIFMGDYVHKCLKCNTVCYEVDEGSFKCPKCGFEWEVV